MIAAVRLPVRPTSLNAERSGNRFAQRRETETTLTSTQWILRSIRLPKFTRVHVLAMFDACRPLPDPGNNYGVVKAMLDAVVKEHLLVDDNSTYVASITMFAPSLVADRQSEGSTLILNNTDRKLVCEDCNRSVSDIIAADGHGGACLCALPHEGIDSVPQPRRGRR